MLPFQTDEFDPGKEALVKRVCSGPKVNKGFIIGATVYDMGGQRWIVIGSDGIPGIPLWMAYPLPDSWGVDLHAAVHTFTRAWSAEAGRLGLWERARLYRAEMTRTAEKANAVNRAAVLAAKARKAKRGPKPKPHELPGAVVLPGLDAWLNPTPIGTIKTKLLTPASLR